jgi:UDP-3-O-[3-hydroxymyristoyl] glucosamine N-acyltransferase
MSAPVTMPIDIAEIWRMLPHRYPFLLIDRVVEFESGKRVLGHLELCDRVIVTAMSLVTHSIREAGEYSSGTPIQPNRQWRRNAARFRHLDEIARRLGAAGREDEP